MGEAVDSSTGGSYPEIIEDTPKYMYEKMKNESESKNRLWYD